MTAATGGAGRRYALLMALHDSEYATKTYGGYRNVFVAAFGGEEEGERWDSFRVVDGEFPAQEDLPGYDGFVITGSPHDAYGDEAWIRRLCLLIQTLHAMRKRVLGVCFGHQVLCRALGGKVGKARTGWDVGVRKVTLAQDLSGFDFLGTDLPLRSASIVKVHQDEVLEVPPRARVLAYSDKTRVEAFAVGDHALGVQGHPEYGTDILHNLIDRLVNNGCIQDAHRTAVEAGGPDTAFWTALCKAFLRAGEGSSPQRAATAPKASEVTTSNRTTAIAGCFVQAPMLHQVACSAGTGIN
jgi:glucosinolate gamma-glutamyl hydrolase